MLQPAEVIDQLESNAAVFKAAFDNVPQPMIGWKPTSADWCLLEIACHLRDEERDDFRARVKNLLADPPHPLEPIDPQGWVESRRYVDQDFGEVVRSFLDERHASVGWLRSLEQPRWDHTITHDRLGPVTAGFFLENWLAHDYLHVRQINRRKYQYLRERNNHALDYAGDW